MIVNIHCVHSEKLAVTMVYVSNVTQMERNWSLGLGDNDVYWPPLPFKSHHGAGPEGSAVGERGGGAQVENDVSNAVSNGSA